MTPVHHLDGDYHLLELFHGPTYAFKDVALQFLGVLFELILTKKPKGQESLTIIGATSGDTGSSAIAGVRGKEGVECFILYAACINQIVATRLHHGSIITSTPSTRRRLDGVPLGVSHRSTRSARSWFRAPDSTD